jgi:hypothetical protein
LKEVRDRDRTLFRLSDAWFLVIGAVPSDRLASAGAAPAGECFADDAGTTGVMFIVPGVLMIQDVTVEDESPCTRYAKINPQF